MKKRLVDGRSSIFNDSAAMIEITISDGLGDVDFESIGQLWFIRMDLRLQEIPQEKPKRGLNSTMSTSVRDNHTPKAFIDNAHRGVRVMAFC